MDYMKKKEIKTKYLCKNLGQNLGLHVTFIRFIGNQQGQSVFLSLQERQ